jgi:AraC-like DNA-binding protein
MAESAHGRRIGTGKITRPVKRLRPGLVNLEHRLLPDAADAYAAMAPVVPLRRFQPLVREQDFHQEIGLLEINRVRLMSYVSAPALIRVEHASTVRLAATFAGRRLVRTPSGVTASQAGGAVLFPPGPDEASGSDSVAVVAMQPEDLARAGAAMAGDREHLARLVAMADGFRSFQAHDLSPLQARQVHALLQHLDACLGCHPALPSQLGLDDVLLRMVLSWLQPQLLEEQPADSQRIRERAGRDSFDELIDYIRANLDQPLRLSDLEARSHYSSRALQYAFRERLGCTPRQWIRQQRLEKAMGQLQQGGQGCSIRAIALACGYRHMSHFSSDFKQRFGLSPSAARGGGETVLVQVYPSRRVHGRPSPSTRSAERPLGRSCRGVALPR